MKRKIVQRKGKWKYKFSLDMEDIVTLIIALLVLSFVLFQFVIRG